MNFRLHWRALAAAVAVAVVVVAALSAMPERAAARTIRIVPIGDSITQGGRADRAEYTYRYPLFWQLRQAGYDVDFLGSQRGGLQGEAKWPDKNGVAFDLDHEGHYGWKTAAVRDKLPEWSKAWSGVPDIALIHLGTNDQGATDFNTDIVKPLQDMVTLLRSKNPRVAVFIAHLNFNGGKALEIRALVEAMARGISTTQSPVATVHHYENWVENPDQAGTDTFDWAHPNPQGQAKMADKWLAAMKPVLARLSRTAPVVKPTVKPLALNLPTTNAPVVSNAAAPITAYANNGAEVVMSRAGQEYLRFGWALWGPNWAWTGLEGQTTAQNGVSSGEMSGKLGGTQAPVKIAFRARKTGPRSLQIEYSTRVETDSPLTMIVATFNPGAAFNNSVAEVVDGGETKTTTFPLGMRGLGAQVRSLKLSDADKRVTTLKFNPPVEIGSDGVARIMLAKDNLKAGQVRAVSVAVELPQPVQWYGGVGEIPDEPGLNLWYRWNATGDTSASVLGMESWNTQPAGRYGRIARRGSQLIYNNKPIKLWGLNLSYGATAPEKALADKRAAFYRKYGINAVRLHKWADGAGWAGIQSPDSAVEFDAAALDRFDYQIAKLKEAGIFVKLSATFGSLKLGVKDKSFVPWIEEFGAFRDGRIETPHSAIHYSPQLQAVQIAQVANLLKHRNPYTKLTYAEDPAVSFIEIINEQSILFYSSIDPLKRSATLRRQVGQRFSDWLRLKYKDQKTLDAAWGEGGMNAMASELAVEGGESLALNSVLPIGNPWFWDPDQLNGSQKPKRQRLLDTLQFLTTLQDEFYARYVKAMRDGGYKGEMVSSNWQAGRSFSHFANLHSDALIGTIDRHNYFGGTANATMMSRAGSGLLSTGMQQVADRPFMLSEWIHTFPNEHGMEGPAILGAYGMGLQGWDVSYLFQNDDSGAFSDRLGRSEWDVTAPQLLGVFPAVSRHIMRGDVQESKVVATRNVHFPSLFEGKIGFDDKVVQGYDVKELDSSKVPARALAVARSVVTFTPKYGETPVFSLQPYQQSGALVSATKQLSWTESPTPSGGFFTMNTPATKAVVGWAQGRKFALGNVTIEPQSPYGAIYLSVREPQGTIETAKELIVVAMARARNTGQKFSPDGATMLARGEGPILMEPVKARLSLRRSGTPQVFALDHDGRLTATTIAVRNGVLEIDGARDKTPYYLVRYP
jgi:lysophospholipase L1-like esterase